MNANTLLAVLIFGFVVITVMLTQTLTNTMPDCQYQPINSIGVTNSILNTRLQEMVMLHQRFEIILERLGRFETALEHLDRLENIQERFERAQDRFERAQDRVDRLGIALAISAR